MLAGLTAAVGIGWFAPNLSTAVHLFGAWAIVSGGIQLVIGMIRRRSLTGQWLMIVSGGGSMIAGITFGALSGSPTTELSALAQYSLGGAVWHVLTAAWLFVSTWNLRRLSVGERGVAAGI